MQELQDHHIFPQAYLRRHGISRRVDVNSIANRTLISSETNSKISDMAPTEYLCGPDVFPSGVRLDLLAPHFIDSATLRFMERASEGLSDDQVADVYSRFIDAREASMVAEIRRVCGITAGSISSDGHEPDDVAADLRAGNALGQDQIDLLADEPPLR